MLALFFLRHLFSAMGVASSTMFASLGAGYGISKSGLGVVSIGILSPHAVLRGLIPVVMAELLAIYGFITSLNILMSIDQFTYSAKAGFLDMAAGLTVGLCCLVAGLCIGIVGDANNRAYGVHCRRLKFLEDPPREKAGKQVVK